MNEPARREETAWQDRNVVVVGAGVSGLAAAHLLLDCGARVTLTDARPESEIPAAVELTERGVTLVAGEHPRELWTGVDTAVFSPGIRPDADGLEAIGIDRARRQLSLADCRILLLDTSVPPHEVDRCLMAEWPDSIVVIHKCDLPNVWGEI